MNRSDYINVYHDYNIHKFSKKGLLNFNERKKLSEHEKNILICQLKNTLKDNCGYISAAYRLDLYTFNADKTGVIIRHPEKLLISYANMHKNIEKTKTIFMNYIEDELKNINNLIENGSKYIKFEKMTNDPDYLKEVLKYFDIYDVNVDNSDLKSKINKFTNKFSINDFDEKEITYFRRKIDWFIEKYNLKRI